MHDFSISHDPFLRLSQRLHLTRANDKPRASVLVAITWVPLCVGALLRVADGQPPAPILYDISVHTRLLVAIPLFLLADRLLEWRCQGAVAQLYEGAFCDATRLDRIVGRAIRLRDSRFAEIAIATIAAIVGQASLWGITGSTGLVSGVEHGGALSFAHVWYATVALPIVQFLLVRWLWHWSIWSYVVIHVSRLELATIGTHPDHAGGIGFISAPVSAFWMFVGAVSAMAASAWGTEMLATHAPLKSFVPTFVVFVLAAALLGCGPLLAYVGVLYRTRYRETRAYSGLARDYVRAFHHRWIEARSDAYELLGAEDIESLSDMCNSYESLVRIRRVPFGVMTLAGIWIAATIPMLPLAMASMPADQLLRHIGSKMLGGLL